MQTTPHEFRTFEPSSSCTTSTVPPGSRLAQYIGATPQQSSTSSSPRHSAWPQLVSQSQSIYSPHSRSSTNHMNSMVPSFGHMSISNNGVKAGSPLALSRGYPPLSVNGSPPDADSSAAASSFVQENFGGTTYFLPRPQQSESSPSLASNGDHDGFLNEPREYLSHSGSYMYQGPLSYLQKQHRTNGHSSFFINSDLRAELLKAQLAVQSRADASTLHGVPSTVEHYQNLTPIRSQSPLNGAINGEAGCSTFKAFSIKDGMPYILKRTKFRTLLQKHAQVIESWKHKICHSNVISLRDAFTSKAFGDSSLVFVFDYHPLAESLERKHFARGGAGSGQSNGGIIESVIWSYIIQLTSALRTIHQAGLAARTIALEKVLVVGRQRILLSDCATADVVSDNSVSAAQLEDLSALGRLVLCLAVGSVTAAKRAYLSSSIMYVTNQYSSDLKNVIMYLLNQQQVRKSVNDLMPMIGARFYAQLEAAQSHNDYLENELSKELENGRLFRLLAKINSIVERPELNMDATWSETGDRFLLKLFRDYLFHQVNEQGKPWMDLAHIVSCLNKLDAGVPDKVQLVSRDAENVLIVSYADLRRCFDVAFKELVAQQNGTDGFTGCV
ncbi:hypothetical protein QR680_012825 [Steinernema hermaphroditum]|uniref:PAN2-PAN3 deadenylation complex subunit PAN3 n=1 Tax=Steinernema hermaphroditum TaxID=289476 RepID=A0AA39I3D9_9BILA|nr:hypothetical protein QR680_012825 [Steinernema hermaphroditum]